MNHLGFLSTVSASSASKLCLCRVPWFVQACSHFCLLVLVNIKTAQLQHGMRHHDYQRYRFVVLTSAAQFLPLLFVDAWLLCFCQRSVLVLFLWLDNTAPAGREESGNR